MSQVFHTSSPKNLLQEAVNTCTVSTVEIILLYDEVMWIRLFYNNLAKEFIVSQHTSKGWSDSTKMTHQEILRYVQNNENVLDYLVMQYRTSHSTTIYKVDR